MTAGLLMAATSATDVAAVAGACLLAGAVNALAGGGSLLSYPTMVAVGLGPVTANVSNTLALWPGYASGAAALRRRVAEADARLPAYALAAGLGAVCGTVLLLTGNPDTFEAIVPFLVILAALLLAIPEPWLDRLRNSRHAGGTPAALGGVAIAGVYGAYFGGGLGVILLAVLNAFVGSGLRGLNAMKAVLSLLVNTVALVAFIGFGPVAWWAVAAGAPAALIGGLVGARLADRVPVDQLRRIVVVLGLAAGIALLLT
ncbi:MAG TPA: sulfite exporter TauE/SafE family protein [Acidimicrobiales bacterium]|jgi:hypothetical protein